MIPKLVTISKKLLGDLSRAGYAAVLVDRNAVGGAQTLHSHGFLHLGHAYPHVYTASASHFKSAMDEWQRFLAKNPEVERKQPAFVGFLGLANALYWERSWRSAGLHFHGHPALPRALSGSVLERVYETKQRQIRPGLLVRRLVGSESAIVHGVLSSASITSRGHVESVAVDMEGDAGQVHFRPKALVLAAGSGNDSLFDTLSSSHPFSGRPNTRTRRSLMLVVKSSVDLPQISLLVPDLWLFVVSQIADDGGIVWLVSSGVDQPEGAVAVPIAEAARAVANKLRFLLPHMFGSIFESDQIRFGAYEGLKSEVILPDQDDPAPVAPEVHSFPDSNVMLAWPTKLTLAPRASDLIKQRLIEQDIRPSHREGKALLTDLNPSPVRIGEERWARLKLRAWSDFIADLNSVATSVSLDPEQGPEPKTAATPHVLHSTSKTPDRARLLAPSNQQPIHILFHCEPLPIQHGSEVPISGGESGAYLVESALYDMGCGRAFSRNLKHLDANSWEEQKRDNLILLDSPVSRGPQGFAKPHNRCAHAVLEDLFKQEVKLRIRIEVLIEQALNPRESLKLVLPDADSVKVADALWDYGLVARFSNPYHHDSMVVLLAGLHAPATHAAAFAASDPVAATRLLSFLTNKNINPASFVAAFRVNRSYFRTHLKTVEWLEADQIPERWKPASLPDGTGEVRPDGLAADSKASRPHVQVTFSEHHHNTNTSIRNEFSGPIQNLAQNSERFSQTSGMPLQPKDLKKILKAFRKHSAELKLSDSQKNLAEHEIGVLSAQPVDKLDMSVVNPALLSLMNITHGAIGSLIAAGAQPAVWQLISQIFGRLSN